MAMNCKVIYNFLALIMAITISLLIIQMLEVYTMLCKLNIEQQFVSFLNSIFFHKYPTEGLKKITIVARVLYNVRFSRNSVLLKLGYWST
jgi:hypothetical protein